jgi:competence protein ComEA
MQPSSPSPLIDRIRVASAALEVAPAHVIALLVLASCACAGLVALWLTARPGQSVHPTVLTAATPAVGPSSGPSRTNAAPRIAVVHVSGAVASAGVYELRTGARVVDAIDAAGGPRDDARTDQLNLARIVQDGEQIHVPDAAEAKSAGPTDGSGTAAAPGSTIGTAAPRLRLNAASEAELETLPGVGPVLAARIVAQRERTGGFAAAEDLLAVDGIGDKTFAQLRDLVTP